MARFRPTGPIVEAEQWFPGKRVEGVAENTPDAVRYGARKIPEAWVEYGWGRQTVLPGNWIVRYPDGKIQVFDEATFADCFEPIRETAETLLG